ncbi:hypothetical protein K431DRAFT_324408 [Polychaeton citri CBS 116435]|uniref:F-box domain-containing protein n=1 Tax=Polychaeton citri CBS 116435 TaxID=1314669 RepID=A0A9P4UTL4_9PEZI|nr:hypothetical protein K431DRAFT_324408 [Polychaeton citri CBS 116435]
MVKLLDLEEEESLESDCRCDESSLRDNHVDDTRPNPNVNHQFAAALACYPVVYEIASLLDLNSLDQLSRTCRQFRVSLLQHRDLLIRTTLRCTNEKANLGSRLGQHLRASHEAWKAYARNGVKVGRITSGRVGACARDLVAECKKCGQVVCRNCVVKPPPMTTLEGRHRRLCRTCMKCDMELLTTSHPDDPTNLKDEKSLFTYPAFARLPCSCEQNVWLCTPCGQSLRTDDTTYIRGWAWRSRYSVCGGIGAGLGEGNEGVECGRDTNCLVAKEVFKEVECDQEELIAELGAEVGVSDIASIRELLGTSYLAQEIVGIGGRVKTKVRHRVLVGEAVKEYEDERATGRFLSREQAHTNRSWCFWCSRVIPSLRDLENGHETVEANVTE